MCGWDLLTFPINKVGQSSGLLTLVSPGPYHFTQEVPVEIRLRDKCPFLPQVSSPGLMMRNMEQWQVKEHSTKYAERPGTHRQAQKLPGYFGNVASHCKGIRPWSQKETGVEQAVPAAPPTPKPHCWNSGWCKGVEPAEAWSGCAGNPQHWCGMCRPDYFQNKQPLKSRDGNKANTYPCGAS